MSPRSSLTRKKPQHLKRSPKPATADEEKKVSHYEHACRHRPERAQRSAACETAGIERRVRRARTGVDQGIDDAGRPGVQVAAITRRAEGYYIVHVESGKEGDFPLVNGQPIGAQAASSPTTMSFSWPASKWASSPHKR